MFVLVFLASKIISYYKLCIKFWIFLNVVRILAQVYIVVNDECYHFQPLHMGILNNIENCWRYRKKRFEIPVLLINMLNEFLLLFLYMRVDDVFQTCIFQPFNILEVN